MDATQSSLAHELDRRLALIAQEWHTHPVPPLQRADLLALAAIVVVAVLLALIVGVSR
ncbi:MAG: hypothetical protein ACK5MT_22415 [Actinomycetales bacterium]